LPREELSEYVFLETWDAVQRLRSMDGQIMLAAYRARLGNTATAHLADGRHIFDVPALDRHDVHVRYRPLWDSPLHRVPVTERLPVRQAWAWCFVPDGRVVLVADPGPRGALPMLPGGTVEKTDATPEDTLRREAAEEAQLTLTDPVRLGWVLERDRPGLRWIGAQRLAPVGRPGHRHRTGGRRPRHRPPLRTPARHPSPGSRPAGMGPAGSAASPARGRDSSGALGPARCSPRRSRGSPYGGDAAELTQTTISPRLVTLRAL
jgi:8-oxo-dGTP pyrophosphatase MutT (NUDIX family)